MPGLVQERRNSSALAMELRLSCTSPSISASVNWFITGLGNDWIIRNKLQWNLNQNAIISHGENGFEISSDMRLMWCHCNEKREPHRWAIMQVSYQADIAKSTGPRPLTGKKSGLMRTPLWWSDCPVKKFLKGVLTYRIHYGDVIMSVIASLITSLTIVYSSIYSGADQRKTSKLRVTGLSKGNSPETSEFPAQRASNAENVSIWWRHHVI